MIYVKGTSSIIYCVCTFFSPLIFIQVEKSILSDCSSILCAFFTCSATQVVLPLMPILAYVLPVYAQDESLCKSLMDR